MTNNNLELKDASKQNTCYASDAILFYSMQFSKRRHLEIVSTLSSHSNMFWWIVLRIVASNAVVEGVAETFWRALDYGLVCGSMKVVFLVFMFILSAWQRFYVAYHRKENQIDILIVLQKKWNKLSEMFAETAQPLVSIHLPSLEKAIWTTHLIYRKMQNFRETRR